MRSIGTIRTGLALAALALPLAGCISFGAKPPPTLMALQVTQGVVAGPARTSTDAQTIAVAAPTVAPALANLRVAVDAGPNAIAYLKDARWLAPPGQLFRDLLAETITAKTGRIVPDPRLLAAQPDTRLSGHLVRFGLDGPARQAVVSFDGSIVRSGRPGIETRRFTATAPVAVEDGPNVAAALNVAANQVAGEVADWVGR